MAEGFRGWLQNAVAGGGNWASSVAKKASDWMGSATPENVGKAAGNAVNAGEAAVENMGQAGREAKAGYNQARGLGAGPTPPSIGGDLMKVNTPAGPSIGDELGKLRGPLTRPEQAMRAAGDYLSNATGGYTNVAKSGLKAAANIGGGLLKRAPGVAQAYNVADTVSHVASDGLTPAERKREGVRGAISMIGTGAGTLLGGALGTAGGTLVAPGPGTVAGGIAGGATGAVLGQQGADWLSDKVLGPAKGKGLMDRFGDGPTPGNTPLAGGGTMSGSIPNNNAEPARPAFDPDAARAQARMEVGLQSAATPLFSNGTNEAYAGGGFRGAASPAGGKFDDAFQAMAKLGAYGAAGREAKNAADVGLRTQANTLASQKAAFDMGAKTRELDQKDNEMKLKLAEYGQKKEEAGAKRFDDEVSQEVLRDPALAKKDSTLGFGGETPEANKARVAQATATLKSNINYSVGNRSDGKKYGDLAPVEKQQLFLANRVKQKIEAGRSDVTQVMRDFFGNKRADSRDLYSYMPKTGKDGSLQGAEIASLPGGGSYVLKAQNGNTMTASRGMGGEWNITGPNGPIDADIAALFAPHLDAAEKRNNPKGK